MSCDMQDSTSSRKRYGYAVSETATVFITRVANSGRAVRARVLLFGDFGVILPPRAARTMPCALPTRVFLALAALAVLARAPAASAADGEKVVVLTAETIGAAVMEPGKSTFLKVYAPWCGHCKATSRRNNKKNNKNKTKQRTHIQKTKTPPFPLGASSSATE